MAQGDKQDRLFLIVEGAVVRLRFENDQHHHVESIGSDHYSGAFGSLHFLRQDPTYATAYAETDGLAFCIDSEAFNELLDHDPAVAQEVIYSLSQQVKGMMKMRTPLLEQDAQPAPIVATSVGACMETYYRSALNSFLNARLTGSVVANWFPNFHVQIPTRVLYINGFKALRVFFTDSIDPHNYKYPDAVRLAQAMAPGICLTPISSVLEACNAEHMNPEPLHRRWMRGIVPRTGREILFGLGINQLSDLFAERASDIDHPFLRLCAGSLMAGATAGYLSSVPHNLSAMKLLTPHKSYSTLWRQIVSDNLPRVPNHWSPSAARAGATFLSIFAPQGAAIRTAQIMGSFVIINGTIHVMTHLGL